MLLCAHNYDSLNDDYKYNDRKDYYNIYVADNRYNDSRKDDSFYLLVAPQKLIGREGAATPTSHHEGP